MKKKSELYHGMDKTLKILLVLPVLFGLVVTTVLLAGCVFDTSGLAANNCCPTIIAFQSTYDWICPASCPGGGLTRIDYTIEFKDGKNEVCEPTDLKIVVRNVTDGIDLPSYVINPKKGLYQEKQYLRLTKDTEFSLNVTAGGCTGHGDQTLTVHIVNDGSFATVVRDGKLPSPGMTFTNIPLNAGPGVKIEKVQNVNDFAINVTKDGISEVIPVGRNGTALRDQDATGYWAIGLTKENDVSIYNQGQNPNLTINVYLTCNC